MKQYDLYIHKETLSLIEIGFSHWGGFTYYDCMVGFFDRIQIPGCSGSFLISREELKRDYIKIGHL